MENHPKRGIRTTLNEHRTYLLLIMKNISFKFLVVGLVILYSVAFSLHLGNYAFGIFSVLTYLLVNYIYIRRKTSYSFVSFELFFFLSFFLACIAFPLLDLENTEFYWVTRIFGEIQDAAKWRFLNLALVGYYAYMIGILVAKVKSSDREIIKALQLNDMFLTISNLLTLMFIAIFFIQGGMNLMNRYTSDDHESFEKYGSMLFYITLMYTISAATIAIKAGQHKQAFILYLFSPKNLLFTLNSILILPIFLLSGYRSQFLQLAIPLLYLYVFFKKKISNKRLATLFVIGFGLMMLIGMTRGGGAATSGHDIVYYLRDFIIEDAAGVWLVEYTDLNGPTGGSNAILQMVSFIPFLGGILEDIIGLENITLPSSRIFTYAYKTDGTGLGTNIIGDLYYTFGFAGVIIFMFLLGFLIRKLSCHGGIYSLVCFLLMLGNSVFSVRVEFFYIVRSLGFSLIIIWLITQIAGSPKYKKAIADCKFLKLTHNKI